MANPEGIDCTDWVSDPEDLRGRRCKFYQHPSGACTHPTQRPICTELQKILDKKHREKYGVDSPEPSRAPTAPAAPAREAPTPPRNRPEDASAPKLVASGAPTRPGPTSAPESASADPPPSVFAVLNPPTLDKPTGPASPIAPDGSLKLVPPEPKPARGGAAAEARRLYALGQPGAQETLAAELLDPPAYSPAKSIDPASLAALAAAHPEVVLSSPELGEIVLVEKQTGLNRLEVTFESAAVLRLLVDCFPGSKIVRVVQARKIEEKS